jgi:general secretion pathway protein D
MDKKDRLSPRADLPDAEDLDQPAPPVHLDPVPAEAMTLHMTEQSGAVYLAIGRAAGLNVLFDPDFISKTVTVDLRQITLLEALRVLGNLSNTFWKPSTHDTIYVAPNTRAKRTELQQLAVRTFYLSNAMQQNDLNDVQTALRNVIPNAKLYGVQSQNAIVIRGTPDEILLAKNLIASLDLPKPEVLVDLYVMEVSREKLRNIGISLPTSLSITSSSSSTLNKIGSTSSYSYSLGQASVELLLSDSDTQVLQNPSIRAIDGQKATLKIGERIPVATGSYTTATSSSSSSVQTQFQYIDVGVNVEMTPTIHMDRDVTLKLSVEVSAETGTSTIDGVEEPIISQEKADQVVRLKEGEVSILAGLVKREFARSAGGTPGLGEIPVLKYLFSTQKTDRIDDELVFMLVPHVVRTTSVNTGAGREIDTGSGESIQLQRIPTKLTASPVTPQPSVPRN